MKDLDLAVAVEEILTLSDKFQEQNRPVEAQKFLAFAEELTPHAPVVHFTKAEQLMAAGDIPAAKGALTVGVKLDTGDRYQTMYFLTQLSRQLGGQDQPDFEIAGMKRKKIIDAASDMIDQLQARNAQPEPRELGKR